jgi:hypothetical protein
MFAWRQLLVRLSGQPKIEIELSMTGSSGIGVAESARPIGFNDHALVTDAQTDSGAVPEARRFGKP